MNFITCDYVKHKRGNYNQSMQNCKMFTLTQIHKLIKYFLDCTQSRKINVPNQQEW